MLCATAIPVYLGVDAFVLAKRNRFAPLKPYQRWWVYVLFCLAFATANNGLPPFIRAFIGESFVVPTRSMSPTIQPGDRILVDKLWFNCKYIGRGEVVVHRTEGPDSHLFFRRVVGLPGEEIEIRNERVFINGKEWNDAHAVFNGEATPAELLNNGPIKIPSDCFFAMGDNRRRSKDSRMTGPIPISTIRGKARMIYWSQERRFPNPDDTSTSSTKSLPVV